MTHVLRVAALEIGHPIAVVVLMESENAALGKFTFVHLRSYLGRLSLYHQMARDRWRRAANPDGIDAVTDTAPADR